MNREELARVLRIARSRVEPADVGLPAGDRRRVPGLRREEVAALAGVSVDYVVRLEQGRGPHPSAAVLRALSRALRLREEEQDQVFALAGVAPPRAGSIDLVVRGSVQRLLDRFVDLPAMVLSAKSDILAWNAMASALFGDWSRLRPHERNLAWQRFLGDGDRLVVGEEEREQTDRRSVGQLRACLAAYPEDDGLTRLLATLRGRSERFESLWREAPAQVWTGRTKVVQHPDVGLLHLDCERLGIPESDQTLTVYSAEPGSEDADRLDLLRVLGTQTMTAGR
ncbi:XRE family transcriptional regulator [Nocardioides mangrovicus]|uniref:XRE family transcriptional regulator n=1 Tax=Nocardioides mangrovicus TaxID=2478913 RepID=A0A3L8P557_9ACTN|nr:helix-turn-helix transcriptional regulator [Nocardioides mangrovicus]RLV50182.1 XRE family transcriptional regulator [Nocardioides mangrovicus]